MSWHTGQSTLGNQERKMALRLANAGDFDEISKLSKRMKTDRFDFVPIQVQEMARGTQ